MSKSIKSDGSVQKPAQYQPNQENSTYNGHPIYLHHILERSIAKAAIDASLEVKGNPHSLASNLSEPVLKSILGRVTRMMQVNNNRIVCENTFRDRKQDSLIWIDFWSENPVSLRSRIQIEGITYSCRNEGHMNLLLIPTRPYQIQKP